MSRRAAHLLSRAGARLLTGASRQLASLPAAALATRARAPAAASITPRLTRGFAAAPSDDESDIDDLVLYPASQAFVGAQAPRFDAPAFVDGELGRVKLDDYLKAGKYVCLFFYPKDFTYVCPTEIIAFSDRASEFAALNCQVIAASTDTEETHAAWTRVPRSRGGLGKMAIPIVADTTKSIAARYGCLIESAGIALRGLYIIAPDGTLQHVTINALGVGRSVDEALRTLAAIQHVAQHGEVCPAGWEPGDEAMKPGMKESASYFEAVGDNDAFDGGAFDAVTDQAALDRVLAANDKVVVDVYATWCAKCAQLAPHVEALAAQHPGVKIVKVDATASKDLAAALGAAALPTFKLYKGGKETATVVGYKKKLLADVVAKLDG